MGLMRLAEAGGERREARAIAVAMVVCAIVIGLRMPEIVLKGRFWAEEGNVYYENAAMLPLWQALWSTHAGYLNLVANVAGIAGRLLLPVNIAPYLTIAIGLGFQLVPIWLILTAEDSWLAPWPRRLLGAALLVFIPASEEVWLQTICSQFLLTLSCAIVLGLRAPAGRAGVIRLFILCLAPLCGPGTIALAPLFLLRAWADRSRARLWQFVALGGASLVQFLAFYSRLPDRAYGLHPVITLCVITLKHLAIPFLGIQQAIAIQNALRLDFALSHFPVVASCLPVVAAFLLFVLVLREGLAFPGLWWFLAAVGTAFVTYFGALQGGLSLLSVFGDQRYSVVPQALLGLTVLALISVRAAGVRWLARGLCLWLVAVGVLNYRSTAPAVTDGPAWRAEIAAWREEPSRDIAIWPKGWSMQLPPERDKN